MALIDTEGNRMPYIINRLITAKYINIFSILKIQVELRVEF